MKMSRFSEPQISDRSFHFNLQPAIRMPALRDWPGIRHRAEARPKSPLRSCWRQQPLQDYNHASP